MATHERPQSGKVSRTEDEDVPPAGSAPGAAERKEAVDTDIDAILDEIDEVLEGNAEEFVRGFVQKGGQ